MRVKGTEMSTWYQLACLIIAGISFFSSCKVEPPEAKEIKKSKDMVKVTIEGIIYPSKEIKLVAPITAKVKKIYKHPGDRVKAGDVILELDMNDAERKYRKALINYRIAKIRLKEISPYKRSNEVTLNNAREELLKTYEFYKKGYVSLYELKTAEDRYENLLNSKKSRKYEYNRELILVEKKRKEALENLKKAELELEKAKETLRNKYVKSPISGFLAKLIPLEGQDIFRNDVIGEIINLDKVRLKGAFAPGTYPFLHTGMVGEVKCFTVPAYIGNGTVEEIVPIVDPKIGRMILYMILDNRDYILQPKTKCIISFKFKLEEVRAMGFDIPEEKKEKEIHIKSKIKSDEIQ